MNTLVFIIGTGALINFPFDSSIVSDCFEQGQIILENIAFYTGSGPKQTWILNDSNIEVAGWYCR